MKTNKIIDDKGISFYAQSLSVFVDKHEIVLDFINFTPKKIFDENQGHYTSIIHNSITVNPEFAKAIYILLGERLNVYEKKFGKINITNIKLKKKKTKEIDKPSYVG